MVDRYCRWKGVEQVYKGESNGEAAAVSGIAMYCSLLCCCVIPEVWILDLYPYGFIEAIFDCMFLIVCLSRLVNNNIGGDGGDLIAFALLSNSSITSFSYVNNKMTSAGLGAIGRHLAKFDRLRELE